MSAATPIRACCSDSLIFEVRLLASARLPCISRIIARNPSADRDALLAWTLWYSDTDDPAAVDANEEDEDLFAVGLGAELHFMRYVRTSLEVAWPRSKLADDTRGNDDPYEIHVLVTLMF